MGHCGRRSFQSRPAIAFLGRQRGHDSPAAARRRPHRGQWILSCASSGWTITSPDLRRSSSLSASKWNRAASVFEYRATSTHASSTYACKKPEPIAPCAELLHACQRHVVDQPRLQALGDDGQIIARDHDPVSAQITCERKVAGRGEQNGNAIELLAFEQLFDVTRNGFLDHRGRGGTPDRTKPRPTVSDAAAMLAGPQCRPARALIDHGATRAAKPSAYLSL